MVTLRPSCKEAGESYICIGCGEPRCRDCHPSPAEADDLCADCYYEDGDAA